jgi:hypothetical protein
MTSAARACCPAPACAPQPAGQTTSSRNRSTTVATSSAPRSPSAVPTLRPHRQAAAPGPCTPLRAPALPLASPPVEYPSARCTTADRRGKANIEACAHQGRLTGLLTLNRLAARDRSEPATPCRCSTTPAETFHKRTPLRSSATDRHQQKRSSRHAQRPPWWLGSRPRRESDRREPPASHRASGTPEGGVRRLDPPSAGTAP